MKLPSWMVSFFNTLFSPSPRALLGAFVLAGLTSLLLLSPSFLFSLIPNGITFPRELSLQIQTLNFARTAPGERKIILIGGSRFQQGFPLPNELSAQICQTIGDAQTIEISYGGPNYLESLFFLSNLPIDENTYVFLHITKNRLSDSYFDDIKSKIRAERVSLLDIKPFKNIFTEANIDTPLPSPLLSRIVQLCILYKSFSIYDGWTNDKFEGEHWRNKNPKFTPQEIIAREASLSASPRDYTEGKKMLDLIAKYVASRGGHLYLIEMPLAYDFPNNTPGWDLDEYLPFERNVLLRVAQRFKENIYSSDYYTAIKETNIPFRSFHGADFLGNDFYDGTHMTWRGRRKFLPRFLKLLYNEVSLQKPIMPHGVSSIPGEYHGKN